MEKIELIDILNAGLKPIGFKRKGNYWLAVGEKIDKGVDLQRSRFSKLYYINYGFIIKSIPLNGAYYHTFARVRTSSNIPEKDLLNLENSLSDSDRREQLLETISKDLFQKMELINTENDILEYIKTLSSLNMIPITVAQYFNLT